MMTTTISNPRRVFLVRGTGSCGTSWITALLNLHPRVYTGGEWCFARIDPAPCATGGSSASARDQ